MGPKCLFRRQASSGAGQRARTAGWGISSPSWGGHPTLVHLLTPTPQFGKTRIPVGDGAQPCRALERPRGREWAAGANRGTRTSACPDIAPLACTTIKRNPGTTIKRNPGESRGATRPYDSANERPLFDEVLGTESHTDGTLE